MMDAKQVSELLGVPVTTLANWRSEKKGPPYYKVEGAVRYKQEEITAWLKTRQVER